MSLLSPRQRWTRLLAAGALSALFGSVVFAAIPTLFGSPLPMVHVYWRDITAAERTAAERQFLLSEPTHVGERVWSYVPLDTSPTTLLAIVTHPSIEDTDGINRRAFTIAGTPPLTPRRGGWIDGAPTWMAGVARLLAYALASLSAALLLCSAVTSPLLGPGSAFRRRIVAQVSHPASTLRTLPSALTAGVRSRVTARSAETIAVASVFVGTVVWRFLTFTGFTNDHYAHLALAQQMLMGDWPIRDFSDPGWPLTYLLTAAGWLVAGTAMATEWSITAAGFALGAACTLAAAKRLSGSLAIALLVTLFEVLIFPRTYSYPKMLVYGAGALVILGLAAHTSRRRIVLAAFAVAIAFLLRHDHGLFMGAASAVCLALASRDDGWQVTLERVALLTAATGMFLLPWALYVTLTGGLVRYFQAGFDYSAGEAAATALTAWPWFSLNLPVTDTSNAEAWLFWLFWILPLACGVMTWRRLPSRRERWSGELATVGALVVISVLVNASFIRQALQVRLPDAIVPAALLAAWALGTCWTGRWRRYGLQRIVQCATVICIVVSGLAVSQIGRLEDQYDNAAIGYGIGGVLERATEVSTLLSSSHRHDTPSRYSVALLPFFDYVDRCTSVSDRLIVTGEFPDVLVLAGRRFAGDGVVFGAWYSSSTRQQQTLERLEAGPALFALHMGDYVTFRKRFDRIDRYLNLEYAPMADVPVEGAGAIRILVLRSRPPVSVDSSTGWPCFTSTP
jgi:hypothetical protein